MNFPTLLVAVAVLGIGAVLIGTMQQSRRTGRAANPRRAETGGDSGPVSTPYDDSDHGHSPNRDHAHDGNDHSGPCDGHGDGGDNGGDSGSDGGDGGGGGGDSGDGT